MNTKQKNITSLGILDAITYGRNLFNSIANDTGSDDPATKSLSRKGYYNRLSRLVKEGLIIRKNGKYVLTLFGNIIYEVQLGFGTAMEDHFKANRITTV
jgi:hypothetical protein